VLSGEEEEDTPMQGQVRDLMVPELKTGSRCPNILKKSIQSQAAERWRQSSRKGEG